MPQLITVDATAGAETTNSYVELEYANDYWAQHWDVNSANQWAALSDPQKSSVLVQACRVLETLRFTYPTDNSSESRLVVDYRHQQIRSIRSCSSRPQKYNYDQKLQFPRTLEADLYTDGASTIPDAIMFAQCEQAVYMLNVDTSVIANRLQGVSHDLLNVGGVQISQKIESGGSLISPVAYSYCKPLLIRGNTKLMRS